MFDTLKSWYINLWRDLWCFISDHDFDKWQDAHNGSLWRACRRCHHVQTRLYVEMLMHNRQQAAKRAAQALRNNPKDPP